MSVFHLRLVAIATACFSLLTIPASAGVVTGGGPGGMSTANLEMWFRADTGVLDTSGSSISNGEAVGTWTDLSGKGRHAIGDVPGREPTYLSNGGPNGGPGLDFVGGEINTGSRLNVADNISGFSQYPMTGNETAFFALDFDQNCCRGILSGNNQPNRAYSGGLNAMFGDMGISPADANDFTFANNYRVDGVDTPITGAGFHIVTGMDNPTPAGNVDLRIGSGHGGNNDYGGVLSELFLFSNQLNTAQQVIVENYLSSQHGIILDAGDFYGGEATGHIRDVFGIGRLDSAALPGSHTTGGAAGFGIEETGGTLGDGEFVLAGHDMATNSIQTLAPNDVVGPDDKGAGYGGQRWAREWFVDANGNDVDATLSFGFTNGELGSEFDPNDEFALLYREDNSLPYSILSQMAFINGDEVTFGLSSVQNGFYTLGLNVAPNLTPEPSSVILFGMALLAMAAGFTRRR